MLGHLQSQNRSPHHNATEYFLFVGNPGVGKSAIINGVAGKPVVRSKMSLNGRGITFKLDIIDVEGIGKFMDTPGLSDEALQKQAAAAITEALKQQGFYRVFFVLTLEAGRVRPDDKTTMKLILDAAPITDYSIIINKASGRFIEEVVTHQNILKEWTTTLMTGLPRMTATIHFMCMNRELDDRDDVTYTAPRDVIDFIKCAPGMRINSCDVKTVQINKYQELLDAQKMAMTRLRDDKEAMKKEMESQKEQIRQALDRTMEKTKKVQAQAEETKKAMLKELGQQKADMQKAADKADERQKALREQTKAAAEAAETARKEADALGKRLSEAELEAMSEKTQNSKTAAKTRKLQEELLERVATAEKLAARQEELMEDAADSARAHREDAARMADRMDEMMRHKQTQNQKPQNVLGTIGQAIGNLVGL